jgi:hypothetical protein
VAVAPDGPIPVGADEGPARTAAAATPGGGYWLYATDGGVFTFGDATFQGSASRSGDTFVGMAATPSGAGYWLADDDGDVTANGDAPDLGSRPADVGDVATFAARPGGDGYWMATSTGSVEAYGAAPKLGGTPMRPAHAIVAMAPTPSGSGYWLGAVDGGVFTFGDARFLGSMGAVRLNQPVVGMAATPSGRGYWLVASDGGIFTFGDAGFFGSTGAMRLNQPVVGMAATPSGRGYWLVASDGGIFSFGDAHFHGSTGAMRLNRPIAGMVALPPPPPPGSPLPPGPKPPSPSPSTTTTTTSPTPVATLVAAGDIASCLVTGDEATAKLLDEVAGAVPGATVITLGDHVYDYGSASEFSNCYAPNWGRHRGRTRPAVGNHEYWTPGASGYYGYFGAVAGAPDKGYYSYDAGAWHVVVLNSNCEIVSCVPGSPQEQWLRADLAASTARCQLAYWHHPRFNSGAFHGNNLFVAPLWSALFDHGADVVLNGHEHVYERFGPQRPDAVPDPAFGVRQFTVGTGGKEHYFNFAAPQPNSEVRNSDTFGVLQLTLRTDGYDWRFLPEAGRTFTDSGSGACHGRPPS